MWLPFVVASTRAIAILISDQDLTAPSLTDFLSEKPAIENWRWKSRNLSGSSQRRRWVPALSDAFLFFETTTQNWKEIDEN